MQVNEVLEKLQQVFREVFDEKSLVISAETTADDIEDWTSLTHVALVSEIEDVFSIKFKLMEIMSWQNVGDIVDSVMDKLR